MPQDALLVSGTGSEFEGDDLDLGMDLKELLPPLPVAVGSCVDVQLAGQPFALHLGPGQRNALDVVEVVGSGHVAKQAAVRGCDQGNAESDQPLNDGLARCESPPDAPIS